MAYPYQDSLDARYDMQRASDPALFLRALPFDNYTAMHPKEFYHNNAGAVYGTKDLSCTATSQTADSTSDQLRKSFCCVWVIRGPRYPAGTLRILSPVIACAFW